MRVITRVETSRGDGNAAMIERGRSDGAAGGGSFGVVSESQSAVIHGAREAPGGVVGPGSAGPSAGDPEQPKVLVVSLNTVLLAVAIVVGLVVAVWSLAYRTGQKDERGRLPGGDSALLSGELPSQPPVIDDPIRPGGSTPTPPRPAQAGRNEGLLGSPAGADSGAGAGAASTGRPDLVTPRANDGVLSTDPRQPGNNYLELGVLAYRDVAEAIAFLKTHGVDAAAVPLKGVDPAKAKANNAPCLLFLLEGVPSGSYKTSSRVGEMTSEVRRLGKVFQKEHKGASDFSEPLWRLKRN